MSYAIHVRVIQTTPAAWFSVVEKTVWKTANGGTWAESDDTHTLTMGGSGTSGLLRFKNSHGEYFMVALGVVNFKRWCDIVPDQTSSDTGVEIHPTYYGSGDRSDIPYKQLAHLERSTIKGVKIVVDYYKEDGNTFYATITIA